MNRQLRKYIFPNVLAMIGTSCYILADTFFISLAEGVHGITALNLVLPLFGIIYALGAMIGVGSATRFSLERAEGKADADLYFSNAIWCTLLLSSIFVISGIFFPDRVLAVMGADQEIMAVGLPYTRIILCFAPFFMLNYTFTSFVRNDQAPRLAMCATLLSGLFNIVFDYIFMFPMGMGMVGAALATGVSPVVSTGICMLHYFSKDNTVRFTGTLPSFRRLFSACNLGIVALVGELSSGITTMVFNLILLELAGNVAVAAYGVVANLALVGVSLFNGVSLGLQPIASAVHGKGDREAERGIYRHSLEIGLGIAAVLVVLVMVFAESLVAIFNSEGDTALAAYANIGIRIYFAGFLMAAVNIIKSGFLSAVGRGFDSSVIALSRGVVVITAMAFLLSRVFGVMGVWLSFPVSELLTWLVSLVVTRTSKERL